MPTLAARELDSAETIWSASPTASPVVAAWTLNQPSDMAITPARGDVSEAELSRLAKAKISTASAVSEPAASARRRADPRQDSADKLIATICSG